MPFGIPVGTVAIGESGAKNAALYAGAILANQDIDLEKRLIKWRVSQTNKVKKNPNR
jgi:5-(carboxyamino)imidazole ribonucleotide mutase